MAPRQHSESPPLVPQQPQPLLLPLLPLLLMLRAPCPRSEHTPLRLPPSWRILLTGVPLRLGRCFAQTCKVASWGGAWQNKTKRADRRHAGDYWGGLCTTLLIKCIAGGSGGNGEGRGDAAFREMKRGRVGSGHTSERPAKESVMRIELLFPHWLANVDTKTMLLQNHKQATRARKRQWHQTQHRRLLGGAGNQQTTSILNLIRPNDNAPRRAGGFKMQVH